MKRLLLVTAVTVGLVVPVTAALAGDDGTPTAREVVDTLAAGGVPFTYETTETGDTSAVTATDTADVEVTVFASRKAREKRQVRQAKALVREIDEPEALPFLAFATCGAIYVDVADGLRAVDPGPLAAQMQGILEAEYGPCPGPGRTLSKAQAAATEKVCGAFLGAGIVEVEPTIAENETLAIGATPPVSAAWRTAVVALPTGNVADAVAGLAAACRDA